ncbi:hypothetical protein SCP_0901560 [Sparassis crispa]|uniref:Uncharacterized protein n=1 Tax=Sparassis crispa TaxID=139825 RepID=A0A401GVM5_9APHY|nr:hypothetical protein SCP_0901560 [Sparassis crispa]GBE86277.1 hypothetical protein SCP_0901560 [Sparassis crispa]
MAFTVFHTEEYIHTAWHTCVTHPALRSMRPSESIEHRWSQQASLISSIQAFSPLRWICMSQRGLLSGRHCSYNVQAVSRNIQFLYHNQYRLHTLHERCYSGRRYGICGKQDSTPQATAPPVLPSTAKHVNLVPVEIIPFTGIPGLVLGSSTNSWIFMHRQKHFTYWGSYPMMSPRYTSRLL